MSCASLCSKNARQFQSHCGTSLSCVRHISMMLLVRSRLLYVISVQVSNATEPSSTSAYTRTPTSARDRSRTPCRREKTRDVLNFKVESFNFQSSNFRFGKLTVYPMTFSHARIAPMVLCLFCQAGVSPSFHLTFCVFCHFVVLFFVTVQ